MMVVAVSPVIEREMNIYPNYLTKDSVGVNWGEKWEMSHIVELDEETDYIKCVKCPSQNA
jgi:hypothetical protein